MITQFGWAFTGNINVIGLIFAIAVFEGIIYMIFIKKYKEADKLEIKSAVAR
jgi:ferrous iron transport protein B